MKILITGAAGFLGSHLTKKLLAENHSVIGIDDLSTGSMVNLEIFKENRNFQFIEHDVRSPIEIPVEAIFNFACPASPIHYQADPVKTIETNFLGIINMLHLARKHGSTLIQASTSEIYGDPEITPQTENYWGNVNPIGIRSCYDEGKRAAETLCMDYKRQFNVDTRIIRIFNTYGPNMAVGDGRVVSNFIVQALQNENITIYGDGSQSRSFCYVDDLIDGIFSIYRASKKIETPINLGNPNEFKMIELANIVLEEIQSNSQIIYMPLPQDDPTQRCPDISKAKEILSWEPKIQLREGIRNTAEYFKKVLAR